MRPELLRIGRMQALLMPDGARLRDVTVGGEVILRGIGFVVRDPTWGTHELVSRPVVEQHDGAIHVTAEGHLDTPNGRLDWETRTELSADRCSVIANFASPGGFVTNRTGIVVLHALGASRGQPATVLHSNNARSQAPFPALVSPHQPFLDLAGLDHHTPSGLHVSLRFEGDVFETEDQRNWTDASFKTYSRPLELPYPYRIEAGARGAQRVTVGFGVTSSKARSPSSDPVAAPRVPLRIATAANSSGAGPFVLCNRATQPQPVWHWSSTPTVHADDDDTIGETIEPLPDLIATAKSRDAFCRIRIAPISLRGAGLADPRRGSLIEAAWIVGTLAGFLDPAVDQLGFEPPAGASVPLFDRLACFTDAQSLSWPTLPRVRGLLLFGDGAQALVIAHASASRSEIPLPAGSWQAPERLTDRGFVPVAATRSDSIVADDFSVVWLSGEPVPDRAGRIWQ